MWRAWLLLVSVPLLGQVTDDLFNPPPPEVENALRERVMYFYKSHMDAAFRKADAVVHEDSKDIFFAAEKTQFKNCIIKKFIFEAEFTKARAVTECEFYFLMPSGKKEVRNAFVSLWKLDEGKWWWYVVPFDPKKGIETPFGTMKPLDAVPEGPHDKALVSGYADGEKAFTAVVASADKVLLPIHTKSTKEITIRNTLLGTATLRLSPVVMLGLELKLDKTQLAPGETAKLTISYDPPAPIKMVDMNTSISVEPLGIKLPLLITFADR